MKLEVLLNRKFKNIKNKLIISSAFIFGSIFFIEMTFAQKGETVKVDKIDVDNSNLNLARDLDRVKNFEKILNGHYQDTSKNDNLENLLNDLGKNFPGLQCPNECAGSTNSLQESKNSISEKTKECSGGLFGWDLVFLKKEISKENWNFIQDLEIKMRKLMVAEAFLFSKQNSLNQELCDKPEIKTFSFFNGEKISLSEVCQTWSEYFKLSKESTMKVLDSKSDSSKEIFQYKVQKAFWSAKLASFKTALMFYKNFIKEKSKNLKSDKSFQNWVSWIQLNYKIMPSLNASTCGGRAIDFTTSIETQKSDDIVFIEMLTTLIHEELLKEKNDQQKSSEATIKQTLAQKTSPVQSSTEELENQSNPVAFDQFIKEISEEDKSSNSSSQRLPASTPSQ